MAEKPDAPQPKMKQHCWHDLNEFPVGAGSSGTIQQICCFCGQYRSQRWDRVQDETHGQAHRIFKQVLHEPSEVMACMTCAVS